MLGWLDRRSLLAAVDMMKMLHSVKAVPSEEVPETSMCSVLFPEGFLGFVVFVFFFYKLTFFKAG